MERRKAKPRYTTQECGHEQASPPLQMLEPVRQRSAAAGPGQKISHRLAQATARLKPLQQPAELHATRSPS